MPDIGATIRTKLLAEASISTLVGARVHSDVLPQGGALPAITYMVVSTAPNQHLTGIADATQARIQIDCFAATRIASNELADSVRLVLQGTDHELVGSQYILDITMPSGEVYEYDEPHRGSDERRFINTQDFSVFYRTTTS